MNVITAYRDGPLLVRGPVRLQDQEGREILLQQRFNPISDRLPDPRRTNPIGPDPVLNHRRHPPFHQNRVSDHGQQWQDYANNLEQGKE